MKIKVTLRKVRINSGGYAPNGRYFGLNLGSGSIYRWSIETDTGDTLPGYKLDGHVRDRTRDGAKRQVRGWLDPCDVRFFG